MSPEGTVGGSHVEGDIPEWLQTLIAKAGVEDGISGLTVRRGSIFLTFEISAKDIERVAEAYPAVGEVVIELKDAAVAMAKQGDACCAVSPTV